MHYFMDIPRETTYDYNLSTACQNKENAKLKFAAFLDNLSIPESAILTFAARIRVFEDLDAPIVKIEPNPTAKPARLRMPIPDPPTQKELELMVPLFMRENHCSEEIAVKALLRNQVALNKYLDLVHADCSHFF